MIHANDKSLDNYIKNPISNDSVLNINLFGNDLSNSTHKINSTNINSLSEFEKLTNYKNIDSQTKNSSKYLETEESNYTNNHLNINTNLNKQMKINNFHEVNLSNENAFRKIDLNKLGRISLNNQGRNMPDLNNKFMLNYLETDTEINNTSSEYGQPNISKFSKIKNFYSRNNFSKINDRSTDLINKTEADLIMNSNNIKKNALLRRPYSPFLLPKTNKISNSKNIQFSYNINNSIHTPTKLFQIPVFHKDFNKIGENINNKKKEKNNLSPKKDDNSNNNYNFPNINFSNSIKNRILQKSIINSNTPNNLSMEFNDFKKIINPKIRIVSRNMDERAYYNSQTVNDKKNNITEDNNRYINKTTPFSLEDNKDTKIYNFEVNNKNYYKLEKDHSQNNKLNNLNYLNPLEHNDNFLLQERQTFNSYNDFENISSNNNDNKNNIINNVLKSESKKEVKESSKNSSNISEDLENPNTKSESQNEKKFNSNENVNNCFNCNKNLQSNYNHNEKGKKNDTKKENILPINRSEEDREMAFNVGSNYNRNFNDIVSTTSKEAILDENDANLAFINKSSKNSSQKDYVISDSNEVEEIEISGKLISMDYSNSTLKKKSSTNNSLRDKNDKLNSLNKKNKGSNYSLKNNLVNQASNNNIESKVSILDISGLKNSSLNPLFNNKDSQKEFLKSNLNKVISKEDKIKIENLIRNLDSKIDSRNRNFNSNDNSLKNLNVQDNKIEREREIVEKNDEFKTTHKSNSLNNRNGSFGVFKEVFIFKFILIIF